MTRGMGRVLSGVGRRRCIASAAAAFMIACLADRSAAETVTMTTYYPAPAGSYKKITTTEDTVLSRDSGNVSLAPHAGGRVGVGTTNPQTTLDVQSGLLKLGQLAADPAPVNGAMYYNTSGNALRVAANGIWSNVVLSSAIYDSGWQPVSVPGWPNYGVKTYNHNFGAYPRFVQVWFSPTNPPSGKIYSVESAYVAYNLFDTDQNAVHVHYYIYAFWTWDFSGGIDLKTWTSGFYRVYAER